MRIIYTSQALADLEEIYAYQSKHWPHSRRGFADSLADIERQISTFPFSVPELRIRPGVRMVSFQTYPYALFYQCDDEQITILTIRHAARRPIG